MARKALIGILLITLFGGGGFFAYVQFIGLETDSLDRKLPANTIAYVSIRHLRKAAVAYGTDSQLQALSSLVQGVAKAISDASDDDPFEEEGGDIDPETLEQLAKHFKTQLCLALLPSAQPSSPTPDLALISDFYGSPQDLAATLAQIAQQASVPSLSFNWIESDVSGQVIRSLQRTGSDTHKFPYEISWSVQDSTLFLATSFETVVSLLERDSQNDSADSLRAEIQKHEIGRHIDEPDLTFYANTDYFTDQLAMSIQASLNTRGRLGASLRVRDFFSNLGLYSFESICLAFSLSGNKPAYQSLRFSDTPLILEALSPYQSDQAIQRFGFAIELAETITLDTGVALDSGIVSFLKAAPLANIVYFGINNRILQNSGKQLNAILAESFVPRASLLQTLDTGTFLDSNLKPTEGIVWDYAIRFPLRPGQSLSRLLDLESSTLLQLAGPQAYRENEGDYKTLHYDTTGDATLTAGRIALSYNETELLFGSGTLRSLETLKTQTTASPPQQSEELGNGSDLQTFSIGKGSMVLSDLPATCYKLAVTLYSQLNDGSGPPEAFSQFDWGSLAALGQTRKSTTYLDQSGHLYRISSEEPES